VRQCLRLGWGPYQSDHEDANGQFEMNWTYDDALVTAHRHAFFKFMVKELARKHELRATFMPKPFMHLIGNGCHAHVSLWDHAGETNLFHDPTGELGLSHLAYHFLGGILAGGLDGIARRLDPGRRLDINMYEPGAAPGGNPRLPLNLLDALRAFDASTALREALGSGLVDAYVKLRMAHWTDYMRHLTEWEREHTLDV
jgi:glutamine synthetase